MPSTSFSFFLSFFLYLSLFPRAAINALQRLSASYNFMQLCTFPATPSRLLLDRSRWHRSLIRHEKESITLPDLNLKPVCFFLRIFGDTKGYGEAYGNENFEGRVVRIRNFSSRLYHRLYGFVIHFTSDDIIDAISVLKSMSMLLIIKKEREEEKFIFNFFEVDLFFIKENSGNFSFCF